MITVPCDNCGNDTVKKQWHIDNFKNLFCSRECHMVFRKRLAGSLLIPCAACGKETWKNKSTIMKSKSGNTYCSRSCSVSRNNRDKVGERNPNYIDGYGTYRANALRHYDNKCSNPKCEIQLAGIDIDAKMLDAHHIDGDRRNNSIENLRLLCVWCHARVTRSIV